MKKPKLLYQRDNRAGKKEVDFILITMPLKFHMPNHEKLKYPLHSRQEF